MNHPMYKRSSVINNNIDLYTRLSARPHLTGSLTPRLHSSGTSASTLALGPVAWSAAYPVVPSSASTSGHSLARSLRVRHDAETARREDTRCRTAKSEGSEFGTKDDNIGQNVLGDRSSRGARSLRRASRVIGEQGFSGFSVGGPAMGIVASLVSWNTVETE